MTRTKMALKIVLPILSVLFAYSGCVTVLLGDAVAFGHTLFLFPFAGAAMYFTARIGAPTTAVVLVSVVSLAGAVGETVLSRYGGLMIAVAALLTLITFGVGVLASHLVSLAIEKKDLSRLRRYLAAVAAVLLVIMVLRPVSLFFGDPFLGAKSKRELDVWCVEYLTDTDLCRDRFCYDWYNRVYYYEVTDEKGNGIGKLKYWSGEKKIYCSWENKVYKLSFSDQER